MTKLISKVQQVRYATTLKLSHLNPGTLRLLRIGAASAGLLLAVIGIDVSSAFATVCAHGPCSTCSCSSGCASLATPLQMKETQSPDLYSEFEEMFTDAIGIRFV